MQPQPTELQRFLLASSVLRRMSPRLCDATLQISSSAQILAALERDGVFLVSLDADGQWYRYHHLFRELLQTELHREAPEIVGRILSRAAAWHERYGDTDEALDYAHECRDLARAGRILLGTVETLIARGEIETLRGWLDRWAPQQICSDPQLALAGAWVALVSGDAAEVSRLAAVAHAAVDLDVPSPHGATLLRSSLANLRATLAGNGVSQMLRDGKLVVASERGAGTGWVMDGWRAVGTAHMLAGHPEQAIAGFAEALSLTKDRPDLNSITISCLGRSALAASAREIGGGRASGLARPTR